MGSSLRAAPASAGWGSGDPPAPAVFVSVFVPVFLRFLSTDAGLSNRVAERSSAVRGCRAALSHMVLFACCLLPCCTLVFSLSWQHYLARAFSSCFCLSSLLALTPCLHARFWTRLSPQGHRPARPVNGSGVPSVSELSFVFVSLRPLGGLSAPLFVACVFVFVFWLSSPFFMRCLHTFFASHLFSRRRFSSYFPCVGLRDFSSHYCSRDALYDGFCFRLAFPGFHLTVPRLHLLPMVF